MHCTYSCICVPVYVINNGKSSSFPFYRIHLCNMHLGQMFYKKEERKIEESAFENRVFGTLCSVEMRFLHPMHRVLVQCMLTTIYGQSWYETDDISDSDRTGEKEKEGKIDWARVKLRAKQR